MWDELSILLGTGRGDLLLFDLVQFRIVRRLLGGGRDGPLNRIAVVHQPAGGSAFVVVTAGEDGRLRLWKSKVT